MKIKVLEEPNFQSAVDAWRLSRELDNSVCVEDIIGVDAQINDIPSYVLHIESTVIEREIFSSMRDHVMWASTSRVQDVTKFEIDEEFTLENPSYEGFRQEMIRMKGIGIPQDEYRMLLPIVSMTSYTIRVSFRSLVKIYLYFMDAFEISNRGLFYRAYNEIEKILLESLFPLPIPSYAKMSFTSVHPRQEIALINGDQVAMQMTIPFALRAQLVRARALSIHDNLQDMLIFPESYTLGSNMTVVAYGSIDDWKNIASKRSCWMTQAGLWRKIIDKISEIENGNIPLPCDGSSCPFAKDAELRLTDADPGAPCPVYCEKNDITISAVQTVDIMKQIENEGRSEFWSKRL